MTASEKQIMDTQVAILERLSELAEATMRGDVPQRFLPLRAAAKYCGFGESAARDPKCRTFLRFVKDEEIPFKQGNTVSAKVFDVVELNRAMKSRLKRLD